MEEKEIELSLTIFMYILAVLGLILVSACVIFTAVFRKKRLILSIDIRNMHFMSHVAIFRLVRLMSPTLTAITCVGCFLLYFCIFFAAIQSKTILPTSIICNVMFPFLIHTLLLPVTHLSSYLIYF